MPVTNVTPDIDNRTLTITAEFAAPVSRIWEVYADARQIEQVFGPPGFPATFVKHELRPGGASHYFMTSPDGDKYFGFWNMQTVEDQKGFSFEDGFANDETFAPNLDMPVSQNTYEFQEIDGGTRAVYTSTYDSTEGLQKVLDMGVIEGASTAINQIDALVAS